MWELYLEYFLDDKEYNLHTQGYKNRPVEIIDYQDANFRKKTYPDYVFSTTIDNEDKPLMILDAKFKPDWGELIWKNYSFNSSMLEDYNKCIRDMNSINAHATGVIFPTNIDFNPKLKEKIEHNISQYNNIDKFYTFPIIVPYLNYDKYPQWLARFKDANQVTINVIKDYIIKEKEFTRKNKDILNNLNVLRS